MGALPDEICEEYEDAEAGHSEEDYRCPVDQAFQVYTALTVQGIPARMCLFMEENHELSRSGKPKHRVRRLKEITDWMEMYLK